MSQTPNHALPPGALARISEFVGGAANLGAVEPLPLPRLVGDYCEKFIALDRAGRPVAFIAVSPSSHPGSVRDAAAATRAAQAALPATLGQAVLAPWFVGDLDGRSYSITAWCQPMSHGRLAGRWQRLRLARALLAWLEEVNRASKRPVTDIDAAVRQPLETLAAHERSDTSTRAAARLALDELERGLWCPRSVLAHNDLWWGNFVHCAPGARSGPPFHVIDWAGAQVEGMPFYDLVRLAQSLRISRRHAGTALLAHCAIMECRPEQSVHYLCVAFGRLLRNLGEWPEEQFVSTARSCLRYAVDALRATGSSPSSLVSR